MKKRIALLLCTALCAAVFAQNASDFKTDGKGTITGYDGWDTAITIPAQIGGVAITAIADGAFKNLALTELTLPASLKTIGSEAFRDNKLTSLALPAGVSVGNNAFTNNQLTTLTAGDGVTIGEQAFSGNRLESLTVGNGGSIAGSAFKENNNLKNLTLGAGIAIPRNAFSISAYYDYMCNSRKAGTYDNTAKYEEKTEGDYRFVLTKYGAVIINYTGNDGGRLEIPAQLDGAEVTGIGGDGYRGAFQRKNISRMRLPNGIVFIGDKAFSENQLTSVTIPNSVTSIGESAFSENKLTSVTIPNSVTSIGVDAFKDNQLTSVTIPNIRKTARFT